MNSNELGVYGESFIYTKLIENGIDVDWSPFHRIGDFITSDNKIIDVKYSKTPQIVKTKKGERLFWNFNIHHHGKKQYNIDFYICVLSYLNKEIIFVFPSKYVRGYQITISERQLERGKFNFFENNWDLIK